MSNLFDEISKLNTEQVNPNSINIDIADTAEILTIINDEDRLVAEKVNNEIPNISIAVDEIYNRISRGGRLFYFGAGTSGRLGILDAAECPPTFGTDPEIIQGIMAGGKDAVFKAKEGAEDSFDDGKAQINLLELTKNDIVFGIAASGRTPFVRGVIKQAMTEGIYTIFLNTIGHKQTNELGLKADCIISVEVGPEVIMGSTRMKSGTAQKLVLNMISTAVMIKMGKTYNNIMVDLQMTNAKLKERAKKTIMMICKIDYDSATALLESSNFHVKSAIVIHEKKCTLQEAKSLLDKNNGFVKKAISE